MKVDALIKRSLRLIRVIDVKQSLKAVDFQTGLEALNGMATRWEADGVSIGWSNVENPSDDVPAQDEVLDALAYNLAVRLRPEYGVELDPDVMTTAAILLASVYRDVLNSNPVMNESTGPMPNSGYSGYSAYYDGYGW